MVLFIIGEKIKKIHWCKPEIFFIWLGYVFFGLHKVISTLNICLYIKGYWYVYWYAGLLILRKIMLHFD